MLSNCGAGEDFWDSVDCKIIPVNRKGNQPWIRIGRTVAEAEIPILWPPDVRNWLIWKDPDTGKDWSQEKKGMTEDEMVRWHHWLDGHEFEQAPGVGNGQGSLACCSPWGHKESDMTERMNWTEKVTYFLSSSQSSLFQRCAVWLYIFDFVVHITALGSAFLDEILEIILI